MAIDYLQKILTAKVYDVAIETPLDLAPTLSARLGSRVLLKREDQQPVFSFKLRGAYNKMAHLSTAERARGVIAASIYSGCPNIGEFFPEDSFIRLDVADLAGFETAILPVLGPEDYRRRRGAIAEARMRVLKRYNLLNLILQTCRSLPAPAPRTAVTLVPEARPSYLRRKATAIRRKLPW